VNAYAESLTPLFGYLAPLFLLGLALVLLLPNGPLGATPTAADERQAPDATAETTAHGATRALTSASRRAHEPRS
jgi:hypothetical protein